MRVFYQNEMYAYNMHIAPYEEEGNRFNHEPLRTRSCSYTVRKLINSEGHLDAGI